MAKPQQPEMRRSERVPALSPDASEAVLSAEDTPPVDPPQGPVPEDQASGNRPDEDQDKPDLDAMAEALGVPAEGDEPDDAPHVEPDDSVDDIEEQAAVREERVATAPDPVRNPSGRTRVKIGMIVLAPAVGYVIARAAVRAMRRPKLPWS